MPRDTIPPVRLWIPPKAIEHLSKLDGVKDLKKDANGWKLYQIPFRYTWTAYEMGAKRPLFD